MWSAPRTWVTGELVTSTIMNQHVRDNLLAINSIPAASVYHNASQVINTGGWTSVAFNSERYDTDLIHDPSTNNNRLTFKTAGKYTVGARVQWDVNGTGWRYLQLTLDAATILCTDIKPNHGGAITVSMLVEAEILVTVNQYVHLMAFQDSGAGLGILTSGQQSPEFWVHRLSE